MKSKYRKRRRANSADNEATKRAKRVSEFFERYIKKSLSTLRSQQSGDTQLLQQLKKELARLESGRRKLVANRINIGRLVEQRSRIRWQRKAVCRELKELDAYEAKSIFVRLILRKPFSERSEIDTALDKLALQEEELDLAIIENQNKIPDDECRFEGRFLSESELDKKVKSHRIKQKNAELRLEAVGKAIDYLKDKEAEVDRIRKHSAARIDEFKAYKAAYLDQSRELAKEVRRALFEQTQIVPNCPYCGNSLGSEPHADHIYPVSKGGLSTAANMVLVCKSCNLAKSNFTLREFIEIKALNRVVVERNLRRLKKDF